MCSTAIISTKVVEDVDIYDGGSNGEIFTNFIVTSLVPFLQPSDGKNPGSVVVMDNAFTHYVEQVVTLTQNTGATVWYLVPYSPDHNPLELFVNPRFLCRRHVVIFIIIIYCTDCLTFVSFTPQNCF